jgi:hypothetical protein
MNFFKNAWSWLVQSSADPARISLTVRGALLALVPTILGIVSAACGFGVVCLGVDEPTLNQFIEAIVAIIQAVLALVAAFWLIWGLIRKIVITAGA